MIKPIETVDEFLDKIVIPAKRFNIHSQDPWSLKDTKHNFLLTSDVFATQLGFSDHTKLINYSMMDLDFSNQESLQHLIFNELQAIAEKKVTHTLSVFELKNTLTASISSIIPIFFKNEVVALEIPSKFLNQTQFNLELFLSINSIPANPNPEKIFTKNKIEEHIIYLMMLKKTQQQIAKLLHVSRSRISQRIAIICERAKIPGYSAKLMIEHAFAANYHKRIPLELFFIHFTH